MWLNIQKHQNINNGRQNLTQNIQLNTNQKGSNCINSRQFLSNYH